MKPALGELKPKVILGVAAHPDDLDFGMAGSIAKWINQGAEAYYLILTDGSNGSEDRTISNEQLRDIRRTEQRSAAQILGVKDVYFYDHQDGNLCCDQNVKADIARYIRKLKPDVVMTMDPTMIYNTRLGIINHSDHRMAGQATLDAVYPLARDFRAFPELITEGLEPHKVATVLLQNFEGCNYFVDISGTIETKLKALAAHKSQFTDEDAILNMIRQENAVTGKEYGYKYAEGFVRIDIR